jgi:hemerythrin
MSLIDWSPSLSVGIVEIDEQHKKLIGIINRLNDAMKAGKGKDALSQILSETADYTIYHFGTEEKYMQQFGYPGYQRHKIEHKGLLDKVTALAKDLAAGKITITLDVMTFLKDWLSKHIVGTDKQYGPFFNQKGLK